jgi:YfiH family protein
MLTLQKLDRAAGVRHAFFTRRGGISGNIYASLNCGYGSDDDRDNVTANRGRAMAKIDLSSDALATTYQVHGTAVQVVEDAGSPDNRTKADAMVCRTPGIALGILTADCAPVLFADASARVIGAAHAGWRGALSGVLDETVAAMERLGARRGDIVAGVGPCIAQTSYQVGPEFRERFVAADTTNEMFFSRVGERDRFDLEGYVVDRLRRLGVAVEGAGADTCADRDRFFSYRRSCLEDEPDFGRGLSAIVLAG